MIPKKETLAEWNKKVMEPIKDKISRYLEEQTKKQQEEKEKQ